MAHSNLRSLLVCSFVLGAAAEFSADPDIEHLYRAGSYGNAAGAVQVEMQAGRFVLNRFGEKVPQFKPGDEADILHLKYLTLRGLADLPALILEVGGLAYRATYYSKSTFVSTIKSTLEFGRLPVLETDGQVLSQSAAIVRYLAVKTGLDGSTPIERARVDSLYETVKELFESHNIWGRAFDAEVLRAGATSGESVLHFRDTSNRGDFTPFQKAMAGLKTFEDVLLTSRSGFLVGNNLTYVDLALWQKLYELGQDDKMGPGWADKLSLPQLGAFTMRLYETNLRLASFVGSSRRMPRFKFVDGDYVYMRDADTVQPVNPKLGNGQEL